MVASALVKAERRLVDVGALTNRAEGLVNAVNPLERSKSMKFVVLMRGRNGGEMSRHIR